MKKDDLLVLAMAGGAAMLIAKAAGLSLPSLSNVAQTFSTWNPLKPNVGTPYNPLNPGQYLTNAQLIDGTINEYYGGKSVREPTVIELFDSVLQSTFGTKPKPIIANDNAWWYRYTI